MTDEQYEAIAANMCALAAYQQQMIGHLVGLVHGLKGVVVEIAKTSGIGEAELERIFADSTRKMTNTLAEIPFPLPGFPNPKQDRPSLGTSSGSSPPTQP